MLALTTLSLLVPAAFSASTPDDQEDKEGILQLSHGVSIVLLIVYLLYLFFQVTHISKFNLYSSLTCFFLIIVENSHFFGTYADYIYT